MNKTLATALVAGALSLVAATACTPQGGYSAQSVQVLQHCMITDAHGNLVEVDDDYCEDHRPGYFFYYGGHRTNGYWAGGYRTRPTNTVIIVRDSSHGGSSRTVTSVKSYNKTLPKTVTGNTSGNGTGTVRSTTSGGGTGTVQKKTTTGNTSGGGTGTVRSTTSGGGTGTVRSNTSTSSGGGTGTVRSNTSSRR